jgi:thioredoxin-related protein
MLSPTMQNSGLPYEKINVDNDTYLTNKYGVRNVPTLIKIDNVGNEIGRMVGNNSLNIIKNWYNQL